MSKIISIMSKNPRTKPIFEPTPINGAPIANVVHNNTLRTIMLLTTAIGCIINVLPLKVESQLLVANNSFSKLNRSHELYAYSTCPGRNLCPSRFPICCDGYCISPGDKCCNANGNSCDPGEECCAGECCKPGYTCNPFTASCDPDPVCAVIYDPGVCIQPGGHLNKDKKTRTQCMWNCAERRCLTAVKNIFSENYVITPTQRCPDLCNMASTCRSCLESTNGGTLPCAWCYTTQTCFSNTSRLREGFSECYGNPLLTVVSTDQCASVMWRGEGLYPTTTSVIIGGENMFSRTGMIILLCLTFIAILGIGIAIMRILCILRHSSEENFGTMNNDSMQQVAAVVAAIPRYGFDEKSNKKDSGKPRKNKKKSKKNSKKSDASTVEDSPQVTTSKPTAKPLSTTISPSPVISSKCCICNMSSVSEAARGTEINPSMKWTHVILFPCRHGICKTCLLNMQEIRKINEEDLREQNSEDKSLFARTFKRHRDKKPYPNLKEGDYSSVTVNVSGQTPSSTLSSDMRPLTDDHVNEKAVLNLLPTDSSAKEKPTSLLPVSTAGVWGPEKKQLERAGQQQAQLQHQAELYAGKKCPFCGSECTLLFIPTKMMKE